jgi:transcription elongation factor Elf1
LKWAVEFINRVVLAARILFRGVANREGGIAIREVLEGRRPLGFPCPRCSKPVVVPMESLLTKSVQCGNCGLSFSIDWNEDQRAVNTLKRLLNVTRDVEAAKRFRK